MNLILDVGNTQAKLAVFDHKLLMLKSFDLNFINDNIDDFLKLFPFIKNLIVCSVVDTDLNFDKYNFNNVHFVSENSIIPFENLYDTPKSLGNDRIALVSHASISYPNQNVLIIDTGSCITYDFINENNQYLGGAISPGLNMRFKSLNKFTSNLPLVKPNLINKMIGKSTYDSINIGVLDGVVCEIEGFVHQYLSKYNNLTVILTGGDSDFLSNQLKISIFANRNFLLEGLNDLIKLNISS
ncbi:type III pantothenate kinase [Flavobacteriaceae bacterium]|jgi:type III pantothenate kinase|nr:type III pantothenate kinase [Flavobacteriaceae bacterium]